MAQLFSLGGITTVVKYCIIIAGIVLLGIGLWRYSSLSRHYVPTQATVLRFHPHEHESFDYLFTVSGTTHFGTAYAQVLGRDLASMKIGEHVTVFYDAQHPDDSTAEPPSLRGIMSVWMLVFGGVLLAFWFRLHHRYKDL